MEERIILEAIAEARKKQLWGELTIRFEWGKPIILKIEETRKLTDRGHAQNERYNGR
jgi:hypothetical protein